MAATCNQYDLGDCCPLGVGGIRAIYMIRHEAVTGWCLDDDGRMQGLAVSPMAYWLRFRVQDEYSGLEIAGEDTDAGTRFVHTVTANTYPIRQENRNRLDRLLPRKMALVLADANNRYWYLGEGYPVRLAPYSANFGQLYGTETGYTMNLTCPQKRHLREVLVEAWDMQPIIDCCPGSDACPDLPEDLEDIADTTIITIIGVTLQDLNILIR